MRSKAEIEENYNEMVGWLDGVSITNKKVPDKNSFTATQLDLLKSIVSNLGGALRLVNNPRTTMKWFLFYREPGTEIAHIVEESETEEGIKFKFLQALCSKDHELKTVRDVRSMYFIAPVTVAK